MSRFLIGAMALGFALLAAAVLAAVWVASRTREHSAWVDHSYRVEVAIGRAQLLIEQAEAARRGYLIAHEPRYVDTVNGFEAKLRPALDRIAVLTRDNPRQQLNLGEYLNRIAALTAARRRTIALVEAGQFAEANRAFIAEGDLKRPKAIRDMAGQMLAEEHRLLTHRDADLQGSVNTFYLVIGLTGAMLLLSVAVTTVTLVRFTRDLAASRDQLRQLNETLEDQVAERTADLTRANEEIQRFAYIVSHDLRSPLVNVMGFTAELESATRPLAALVDRADAQAPDIVTDDARLAAKEDLPEAISFIRTSTQRMDRLINAILRLSREGRRVIAPEPLDLAEIAEN
ncbi:MAG: CHASE3 domain-containing protein, partial [Acetobacteraceae bacterium]|nr:CHASE3 domain-containing protein [Acetobacteraceae bacterium]